MDLVLVARKEGPLAAVAEHLEGQHHVSVTVLPGDLSDPDTPRQLFDRLAARGLRVDVLVNNAGFGVPGDLCDVAWTRHRDTIEAIRYGIADESSYGIDGQRKAARERRN